MKRVWLSMVLAGCAAGEVAQGGDGGAASGPFICAGGPADAVGECRGEWLFFCFEGEARRLDCSLVEAECGLDPVEQIHRCIEGGAPPVEPPPDDPPFQPPPDDPPPDDPPPDDPPPDDPPPDDPPDQPCSVVLDGRTCEGDTVLVCRDGEPAGRTDCAANGLRCRPLAGGDVGCVDPDAPEDLPPDPDPPPGGLCAGVPVGSRCEGSAVISCREAREESRYDCARDGQDCEQLDAQWAGCIGGDDPPPPPPDPGPGPDPGAGCGQVPITGRCVGTVFEICNIFEDEVIRVDCLFLGATCQISAEGLAGCVW